MLLADSYMLFKVNCSLIRNPSAVSDGFSNFAAQRFTVAPTVAPTVGFRQLPESLRQDFKVLVLNLLSAKLFRHIERFNAYPLVAFYQMFFTRIYNVIVMWHSKLCENEHENMYSAPQIFKYAYRSYFMSYIECM